MIEKVSKETLRSEFRITLQQRSRYRLIKAERREKKKEKKILAENQL